MAETATATVADAGEAAQQTPVSSFSGFNNLDLLRQLGLMIGLAASVAIGVAVVLWTWEGDYRPLYTNLDQIDSSDVLDVLDSHQIKYRIDHRSGALLVAAEQIHQARLQLASAGMASDRVAGFELLDKEQPLGTSQFMENARYRRSLEGELSRTIASIGAVRSARVHLAIPKNTAFLRDTREPRASVLIEGFQGRSLDEAQVRAIANLVASSVPELHLKNVTVVDQRGNLLSHFNQNAEYAEAARQLTYTRQVETDLLQRISSLLDPILGADKYRAEVAADLDLSLIHHSEP
ncbi:flagellar M-ring protein FliF, partial [bacterium]|nr:flagellar M-ring protein FliF [bacterium]